MRDEANPSPPNPPFEGEGLSCRHGAQLHGDTIGTAKPAGGNMTDPAKSLIDQALKLKASERAVVAERLLESLDIPDPAIDAAWAHEADARIEAHDRGEIKSIPAEDVFAKYRHK